MATQGKVQFREGYALNEQGVVSNVATNQAEAELWKEMAADVDGKSIYPSEVTARRASFAEGMTVDGQSITLADGVIRARHLVQSEQLITNQLQVGNAVITPSMISLPGGELSALSANLGTITAGFLNVESGSIDIGSGGNGISILGGTLLQMKYQGVATITLDASTGLVTCNNFNFTTDGAAAGAIQKIDNGVQIGSNADRTLGDTIRSYFQSTNPALTWTLFPGDIWVNTADGNHAYRWSGSAWQDIQDADVVAGTTAIQPGGGVVAPGPNHYITRITTTSGIVISTSTYDSGARTQITSAGMAIYNYYGQLICQADHTNGFWCNNPSSTPDTLERFSVAYNSNEVGYLGAATSNEVWLKAEYGANHLVVASTAGSVTVSAGTNLSLFATYNVAITGYSGVSVSGSALTVRSGTSTGTDSIYASGTLRLHGSSYIVLEASQTIEFGSSSYPGKVLVRGSGCYIEIGGGPKIIINAGTPNGAVSAYKGSICLDYSNAALWVNSNGGTSWYALT